MRQMNIHEEETDVAAAVAVWRMFLRVGAAGRHEGTPANDANAPPHRGFVLVSDCG